MNKRSCGECAKRGTEDCKNPDRCVQGGYKDFKDPHDDHSKFCELCGKRLTRPWSQKESNECWKRPLQCPDCGIVGDLEIQYRSRVRKVQAVG